VTADPFSALEADHREVERLLEALADSEEGAARERAVEQLTTALAVHMRFEEAEIYPLVARDVDGGTAKEAQLEHQLARDGLAKLSEMVMAPGFGAAVAMLKGGIGHHVKEEEQDIFPRLRKETDDAVQRQLAADLQAARQAAGVPDPRVEHGTKAELLEVARDAGVEGRSGMTKDQLREAIKQH